MNVGKLLRKNKYVNLLFRSIFRKLLLVSSNTFLSIVKVWPVSGIARCRVGDLNFKFYNECDDGHVNYFYYNLPYPEKNDLLLFVELSKHSKTIVDIGANTGLFSVLCSISNRLSKIYAIEPYESNADRLVINSKINRCDNLSIHRVAMGETDGEIEFTVPADGKITDVSSVNESYSQEVYKDVKWIKKKVQLNTLDTFRKKNGLLVDLIKCDVETFEMAVFQGAKNTLLKDRPTVLFECYLSDESRLFFNSLLAELEYYAYMSVETGLVYLREGFELNQDGLNYLITPVKPTRSFLSFRDIKNLSQELLLRP